MTTTTAILAYSAEAMTGATADHKEVAKQFRGALGIGVLASLGARELGAVPGTHQLGGLLFTASILPMTQAGKRGTRARNMAVLVSLTPADEIDIEVREIARKTEHVHIQGIYLDQLVRAALAMDYDGQTALNPRYW